jgi:hypothetical protein
MAGEIQVIDDIGKSVYVVIFNLIGETWNTASKLFEAISASNWSQYAIFLSDTTPGTGVYIGNFPVGIKTAGDYPVVAYEAQVPATAAVGDSTTGAREVMNWDGAAEVPVSSMGPSDMVAELYGSFVVNKTTFQKIMQGLAAVNLGDLTEDYAHSTSQFTDVNDPTTVRARSTNTGTSRSVLLN